jgi:uncharacterized protein (DUF302 family)
MTRSLVVFLIGAVVGAAVLGLVFKTQAPSMMLIEDVSVLDFDATVQAIQDGAVAAGWKVPAVHTISETVAGAGFDVLPVTIIELCKAPIAGRVLDDEEGRHVAPMMPCRVAVFETGNGDVVVSRMNSLLLSKLFGGIIEEVMTQAAQENEDILSPVLGR